MRFELCVLAHYGMFPAGISRWGTKMLGAITRILRRFGREDRGVVLILFLLVFMPLLLTVAVVIDFSQTLVVKRQLTSAVDSAALTLGDLPEMQDPGALRDKAEAYIKAHYPDNAIGTLTSFAAVRNGDMVNVSATAEIPTAFLGITGKDKWTITVNSSVFRRENKLEVVMVLDNTGSMAGNKLAAMKSAANTLVDILFGEDQVSDKVKVGIVPFANAVNVNVPSDTAWLDVSNPSPLNWAIISDLRNRPNESVMSLFGGILTERWKGCVRARMDPYDTQDTPPSSTNNATLFTPYFAPDEGFVDRRNGNNYVLLNLIGLPVTNVVKYFLPSLRSGGGSPNYKCGEPIQPLTNDRATVTSRINAMVADGNTVIPEGLAWGWRLISPGAPFSEGAPYSQQDVVKAIILLTDGENSVQGNGSFGSNFTAYGYKNIPASNNQIGSNPNGTLDAKTTEVCNNIKADKDGNPNDKDILLYTIIFDVNSNSIQTLMRNCATDPGKFFNSPSADTLQSAFQSIAVGLNELRIAR
jgi:Flp pilus assembly protein TadG